MAQNETRFFVFVVACSRRSDSGERSKKEREKNKSEGVPLLFIAIFTSHRSPLSERLEQAIFVGTRSKTRKGICLGKVKSKKVRKISPKKNSHALASKYQRREIVRAMATEGLSVDNFWGRLG